jgi:hypothetical protein
MTTGYNHQVAKDWAQAQQEKQPAKEDHKPDQEVPREWGKAPPLGKGVFGEIEGQLRFHDAFDSPHDFVETFSCSQFYYKDLSWISLAQALHVVNCIWLREGWDVPYCTLKYVIEEAMLKHDTKACKITDFAELQSALGIDDALAASLKRVRPFSCSECGAPPCQPDQPHPHHPPPQPGHRVPYKERWCSACWRAKVAATEAAEEPDAQVKTQATPEAPEKKKADQDPDKVTEAVNAATELDHVEDTVNPPGQPDAEDVSEEQRWHNLQFPVDLDENGTYIHNGDSHGAILAAGGPGWTCQPCVDAGRMDFEAPPIFASSRNACPCCNSSRSYC